MNENVLAIFVLGLIAGAPIVLIDALIIRKIRRSGPVPSTRSRDDLTIGR